MIRRGIDYINSIRANPPLVYYQGEVVKDVTEHPAFRIPVRTVAKYYDLHWENEYQKYLRVY
ncbi:MAG: 4-hydroxyphenylacetate 3-hydroxylase N-terminal domain-containing protein, partial [Sulfolobales archaeon]